MFDAASPYLLYLAVTYIFILLICGVLNKLLKRTFFEHIVNTRVTARHYYYYVLSAVDDSFVAGLLLSSRMRDEKNCKHIIPVGVFTLVADPIKLDLNN